MTPENTANVPDPKPTTIDGRDLQQIRKAKLVVVDTVSFQDADSQPLSVPSRFMRFLNSDEQPFSRRMTVGGSWVQVDVGWLEECSQLIVYNEKPRLSSRPTPEQAAEIEGRVIEIGMSIGCSDLGNTVYEFARVRVGESLRLEPLKVKSYFMRCLSGETRVYITAIPG